MAPSQEGISASQALGASVCRALSDKQYEVKKRGAKEIEEVIRFYQGKDVGVAREKTNLFINLIVKVFLNAKEVNDQIGGLVALLGVARGLEANVKFYLDQLIGPVVSAFHSSQDVSIKYYATENLYNLALLSPSDVVLFLDDFFDILMALRQSKDEPFEKAAFFFHRLSLDLMRDHASLTQYQSVGRAVTEELMKGRIPPAFLRPWADQIIDYCLANPENPISLTRMLFGLVMATKEPTRPREKFESMLETITKCCKAIRAPASQEPEGWSTTLFERLSSVPINELREGVLAMLIGLSEAESDGRFKADMRPETKAFIIAELEFFVRTSLLLVRGCHSAEEGMKQFLASLQALLFASRDQVFKPLCEILASELMKSATSNNMEGLEVPLQWLKALLALPADEKVYLPEDCLPGMLRLVSSGRDSVARYAKDCIVQMVASGGVEKSVIWNESLSCACEVAEIGVLESQMSLAAELISSADDLLELDRSIGLLKFCPMQIDVVLFVLVSKLARSARKMGRIDPDQLSCWKIFPISYVLLACLTRPDDSSGGRFRMSLRAALNKNYNPSWIITMVEAACHLLEEPEFLAFRLASDTQLYQTFAACLPASCEMRRVAIERANWKVARDSDKPMSSDLAEAFDAGGMREAKDLPQSTHLAMSLLAELTHGGPIQKRAWTEHGDGAQREEYGQREEFPQREEYDLQAKLKSAGPVEGKVCHPSGSRFRPDGADRFRTDETTTPTTSQGTSPPQQASGPKQADTSTDIDVSLQAEPL